MVFEQMFRAKWIEKKPRHAMFMGAFYALLGIVSAQLIFGKTTGAMAVAFTSILAILSLNRLLGDEENVEIRENKFHIWQLFRDHRDIFEIYIFLFLGIFFVFALFAYVMPVDLAQDTFTPQLDVHTPGNIEKIPDAINKAEAFRSIALNNFLILVVCFILSLIYGAGSIIFITWNASVWGVVFGYAAQISGDTYVSFLCVIAAVLPHMITEVISYFTASIGGGVVSKAVIREKFWSPKFVHVLTDAMILICLGFILVLISSYIEIFQFNNILTFVNDFLTCNFF